MMPEVDPRPFLSIQDTASLLALDYKTVYKMVISGQLPAGKLGGVYRIRRQDLDTFFEQQKAAISVGRGLPAVQPTLCAGCGRALRLPSLLGGKCQTPQCDLPLCTTCWGRKEARFCRDHLDEARALEQVKKQKGV